LSRIARLAQPQHVGLRAGRHPLGVDEDLLHHALGLGAPGVTLPLAAGLAREGREAGARGVADQHQGVGELGRHLVDPSRRGRLERLGELLRGVLEVAGGVARGVGGPPARAAGGALDVGHAELVGRGLGDARGELVGLVDDDRVVVGDHRHVLDRVDREEGVVGDDEVAAVGLLAGELGEALRPERALARTQALAVVDRDLPPLAVGVARGVVTLAAAAGLGLLLRPLAQLEDLLGHGAHRHVDEGALVVGDAGADAVQAGVVGAALEHGVRRVEAGDVLLDLTDRLDQPRQVALDELVLQGEGRGGDDDALVVEHRRDEVAQRLAGAGAGLDEEVAALLHRLGDLGRHLDLAVALLASEGADRGGQHLLDGRGGGVGLGHQRTLRGGADTTSDAVHSQAGRVRLSGSSCDRAGARCGARAGRGCARGA
jgi:hypothetical protein